MGILERITTMIKESNEEAHIRVGNEWMTMKEYRERYLKKPDLEIMSFVPSEGSGASFPADGAEGIS